ncbi:phage-related protein [bacterium endosymbiont of Mortierella elongata FMR23-6]|nr:phage-related protein [bacterium endosymbiont of Mortierella elongata FMR23-6]
MHRRIGTVTLDATLAEQHQSVLRISENPIESGALIADHAALEPKQITITGIVTDYQPPPAIPTGMTGALLRQSPDFFNQLPLPTEVKSVTMQAASRIQRELGSARTLQQSIANSLEQARPLVPWLPAWSGVDSSSTQERVQQVYEALLELQRSIEPIEIMTGARLYSNMLLQAISLNQMQEGVAEFTLTCREIMIVNTHAIAGVKQASGRAGKQAAAKTQKGKVQLQPADKKKSLLKHLLG